MHQIVPSPIVDMIARTVPCSIETCQNKTVKGGRIHKADVHGIARIRIGACVKQCEVMGRVHVEGTIH